MYSEWPIWTPVHTLRQFIPWDSSYPGQFIPWDNSYPETVHTLRQFIPRKFIPGDEFSGYELSWGWTVSGYELSQGMNCPGMNCFGYELFWVWTVWRWTVWGWIFWGGTVLHPNFATRRTPQLFQNKVEPIRSVVFSCYWLERALADKQSRRKNVNRLETFFRKSLKKQRFNVIFEFYWAKSISFQGLLNNFFQFNKKI